MRIGFAGGGSGGHVFPVQSLIKYIDKTRHGGHKFFWFGEKPSLEYNTYKKMIGSNRDIWFFTILSGKRRREKEVIALLKNIVDLGKLGIGFLQSLIGLLYYKIDIIFCKGGYVSLPVVVAGWILRKKILLHESDTTPGLSNRICSKFASVIFTGFHGVFPGKEIVVGQILDDDLVTGENEVDELSSNKTNILVTGGSQGSESVYKALKEILSTCNFPNTLFHVILGTKNNNLHELFEGFYNVKVYDFVDQKTMGYLLQICDVAVTRGGTTSLAEEHLFGLKKIIIPIPWTHDQYKNALYYKTNFDDILIKQNESGFGNLLKDSLLQVKQYKKSQYDNPISIIHKTKEKITSYILQDSI